jgi:hypothetical protein
MSLGGNAAGDGFLLAPGATTYDAELVLSTDGGTLAATLQASPNAAGLMFSATSVNLSTTPTVVTVHATLQSAARGDTTIQVLDGGTVLTSFAITSIKHPVVHFRGRFEARFATDGSFYNRSPLYTATLDSVVPPGWTWGLEGEPEFVPAVGNVPENLETAVGRVVRYNTPVALRSHVAPIVSMVDSISGETTAGSQTFTTGDPLIGQLVNLGPSTYLAGNNPINPADPRPEETWDAALEPMALFEIHLGGLFSGTSATGPFTHKAATTNELTRTPDARPIANGLVGAGADLTGVGLPDLTTFSETRIDLLITDHNALPAGPEKRNLARRIGHLLTAVSSAKRTAVQNANPGAFTVRAGTLPVGWSNKEIYTGYVNANLVFNPGGSSVITYFSSFGLFRFESHMFGFHSDELSGHHHGTLQTHVNNGGSYTGDPHTRTVDGTLYDFQGVGEFTLLRDGERMEVQVRQTPVEAANPVTDAYTGLTVCVSLITAFAARIGEHAIALQPAKEGRRLQFFLDGKAADLPLQGLDLGGYRVSTFDANGEDALRVDYLDGTVLIATPAFWNSYNVWYLNVSVSNTRADEGIMGIIPTDSWLPRLREGVSVGAMPANIGERYDVLYRKFADSWRVTDSDSLFVYESGTSTKTFTDPDWPAEKVPCDLKPGFQVPGAQVLQSIPIEEAEAICGGITMKDLFANCVFDVSTTGDPSFAKDYRLTQDLRLYATSVQIAGHEAPSREDRRMDERPPEEVEELERVRQFKLSRERGHSFVVTAEVTPLDGERPAPTGFVTFSVDEVPMNRPTPLDVRGRARTSIRRLKPGPHTIRATYSGGGRYEYHSSSSPNLLYNVPDERNPDRPAKKVRRLSAD